MNIFLVAVVNEEPPRKLTWGWYEDFNDAQNVVLTNHTDIFERGYYTFAVIEEMPEGVMAIAKNEFWYRAIYPPEGADPKVERIQKPAIFEESCNFSFD